MRTIFFVQNKLILMAGAGTSWQGIGRPQCGQHKLLSFARITAVATVAVVATWGFFPYMSLWCTLFMARFCHSHGVKAATSEIWIIQAWSILKDGHFPQLQSPPEAGNAVDIRFCRVVG